MTFKKIFVYLAMLTVSTFCFAQETTGALSGTVQDPSGAVIPGAAVTVSTASLVGTKTSVTDGKGYYHFSNLPPGAYVLKVDAKGFKALKREGIVLEVGHAPTVDLKLQIGSTADTVEVTSESPQIDVTTVTSQTNLTQDVIDYVPRGTSFQSVIQFAPAARNEPLMGNTNTNGSGSVSPGNGSNGNPYGYSIAGGSDSENSYLVEGQETANLIGGYSHTNVPFDFIQEVQVVTSGIAAEYGGALGGVVNVIMKKGSPKYHGSLFAQFNTSGLNASPNAFTRYNPLDTGTTTSWGFIDPAVQSYNPVKPHTSDLFPGFTLSGPLTPFGGYRDKIFFFVGFNPQLVRTAVKVNYGPTNGGLTPFSQNQNTYYTTARIDAQATKKIRVFGSWLYQLQREYGENLPGSDSTEGYFNGQTGCFGSATSSTNPCLSTGVPQFANGHILGYDAPNTTVNTGADISITQNIVSTTHFGYYFENYHDFGFPTSGVLNYFNTNGIGATDTTGTAYAPGSQLYQSAGYYNAPLDQNFTQYNANKAIQLDQDVAWYKSGWAGTHNFKFGYQLTRNSNILDQHYNEPLVNVFAGYSAATAYSPSSATGQQNCQAIEAATLLASPGLTSIGCQGTNGYVSIEDFGSKGHATSYDHGLFAQDSWTIAKAVTIDYGVRFDKEYLPGEAEGAVSTSGASLAKPIDFSWTDKFAPRVGVAWDVYRNGKLKIFGDYGKFYDTMKLNLAISSFGGQYWQNCYFALNSQDLSGIVPTFNTSGRYCSGTAPNSTTNFATTPTNLTFIESQDFRAFPTTCSTCSPVQEGVAPGLKPYQQHESVFGTDYQISKTLSFEARYDRRRLDRVIEDASLASSVTGSETFVVVNPGYGSNATFLGFCNFLYGTGAPDCTSGDGTYPNSKTIPAARSYDGVELRLNKALSNHWFGMFSYTYSHFRGNYTGLTSSDIADGGSGGRNAPNNSRSFDEPYFQYNASGGSSSGLLPTDRPNTMKGYAYYRLNFLHKFTSDFGIFQTLYQGSPNTTYADVGYSENAFPVDIFNRGKWADITQDPSTGVVTVGPVRTYRNPWYNQTDFNFTQTYQINESKSINFTATFTNLLNEHSVVAVNEQVDSPYLGNQYITPNGYAFYYGAEFYAAAERGYNVASSLNGTPINGAPSNGNNADTTTATPETINAEYGKPLYYQQPRTIRLQVSFTF